MLGSTILIECLAGCRTSEFHYVNVELVANMHHEQTGPDCKLFADVMTLSENQRSNNSVGLQDSCPLFGRKISPAAADPLYNMLSHCKGKGATALNILSAACD